MSYLILHGVEGNSADHWQTWLAARLRAAGERVSYLDLPEPFAPKLEQWLAAIEGEQAEVVVCHSLACLLWLHHVERRGWDAERVLLVAPPCVEVPGAEGFLPPPPPRLANALMVCSDDDPWCPPGAGTAYAGVASDVAVVAGAGHINPDSGYGPWPEAEAWCRGSEAFLSARPS